MGFDLDGVLMRNPFGSYVFPTFYGEMLAAPALAGEDPEAARATVSRAVKARWGALMRQGELVAAYDWDAIFAYVAAQFGASSVPDVGQLVREGCEVPGAIEALPGAAQTLTTLANAGYRLIVITNGYSYYQEPVLSALGLLDYFGAVHTPDRTGAAKPDRRAFEAAGSLDWFVGDTLIHDVFGANSVGAKSVWVDSELPPTLAALPVRERRTHPDLERRVKVGLAGSPYVEFHPEATPAASMPSAVIHTLEELPELIGAER